MIPPLSSKRVAKDDLLRHHSVPGVYRVIDVMHDGRVILLDPRHERQRVWPDYLEENFTMAAHDDQSRERNVVCENCGEVHYTENVGGPDDEHPELGSADRLVSPEDCILCNPDPGE